MRLESEPLSRDEVREATRLSLSYTPNDLVVLDWAAGVVADTGLRRHLAGHRIRQRPAPGIPPHRRPARRPARGRLPAHPAREAAALAPRRLAAARRRRAPDPRARDRGDQPLRAGRQLAETDRRPLPGPRLRGRRRPVSPPRLAAEHPPQARDRRRRLRPPGPASRRPAHGGARDHRRRS